jgi:hypothetical protein
MSDPEGPTYDEAIDALHSERAALVALLAMLYPSTWNYGTQSGDETSWPIVYIDLPTGQTSWQINRADWPKFTLVRYDASTVWDKHTTPEKYERIDQLVWAIAKGDEFKVQR